MRENWKQAAGLAGLLLLALVLTLVIVVSEPPPDGIVRAEAVKSLVLALCGPQELEAWSKEDRASHFSVDAEGEWYAPYFDYAYMKGCLSTEEFPATRLMAEGMLTYGDARMIAEALSPALAKEIRVTESRRGKPFPKEAWWKFYEALLGIADSGGEVHEEEFVICGTMENIPNAKPWTAYTDKGEYRFAGLSMDAYIDCRMSALVRENEIIRIVQAWPDAVYQNVWIISGDEEGLRVYVNGIERVFPLAKTRKKLDDIVQNVADLQIFEGRVTKISLKEERIKGKLLSISDDMVEIEGYGRVPLAEGCHILKIYGTPEQLPVSEVLVGYDNYEYVVAEEKICALLTVREPNEEMVRVLLMNEGFRGIYHEKVTLFCEGPLVLSQGDEAWEVDAGETLEFLPGDERLKNGRLVIMPEEDREITLTSLERVDGNPSYGGRLELLEEEDGLILINEISMEKYLEKVVPSEMSGNFELEALKAQAVCARTYAYMQLRSNRYQEYGAQLDDSVNFQVYNNVKPESRATEAVQATYREMMTYEGEPIRAYYFSTSCGNTSDGSVWGMDPNATPFLKSVALQPGRRTFDWSDEEEFRTFIKRRDVKAYDSDSAFFRWSVTTDAQVLARSFDGIGEIVNLWVSKRGGGGVALELVVKGTEGERTVSGQNAIRSALGDEGLTIYRNDGKTSTGWDSLPSAFLVVEPDGRTDAGVQKFAIYGGGFGHGAGMSQNGAQGMAKAGMKYDEILKFFYDGVEIVKR